MKEVVRLLEGGSNCVDLVNEVLNANNPMLAQLPLQVHAILSILATGSVLNQKACPL